MPSLSRRLAGVGLFAAVVSFPFSQLAAQAAAPPSHWELVSVQSGHHANPSPIEGVVWRDFIVLDDSTTWLRLYFSNVNLEKGSYLRIASMLDGEVMTMRQQHMSEWGFSTAYFNGPAVMVELVAGPGTQKNFVEIDKVMAGDINGGSAMPDTICGSTDDRVPSTDARAGRIDPIGCTGWIIDQPTTGNDKCHLSAGHCYSSGQILEFNVPASGANCALSHPPIAKQFAIDHGSSQYVNGGVGNDYWVFRCFANSTTGRTTFQEQGAAFTLSTTIPATGTTLRNTGYGLDGTNTNGASGGNGSCTCSSAAGTGTRNQTQQTHTGPETSNAGTTLQYQIDTCGGNSGSPVYDNTTGLAVAIHTHGGCTTSTGSANSGTQVTHSGLQAAIATVCAGGGGPSNDDCANAVDVYAGVNGPFNNNGSTLSSPAWPTSGCGFNVGKDVWFRLSACAGSYTIHTCSSARTTDTVMQVFSGNCSGLTAVACNDDGGGTCSLGSSVTVTLSAGIHYIRVGTYNNGTSGNFELSITAPCHGNDECSGALPLSLGANGPYSNIAASNSAPSFPCGFNVGDDCWFTYVVACDNTDVGFETCGATTTFDTVLQVFSGSCSTLISEDCNDDSCSLQSRVVLTNAAAGTYYVRVGGYNSQNGNFGLTVTQVPSNDDCANAVTVSNGTNGPFCTQGSTTSPAWPGGCVFNGGNDVWFSYRATCTGDLIASTCTAARTFDTCIEVFGGSCGSLVSLGCNDDGGGSCGLGSMVQVPVTFGQIYLIRVGGYNSNVGITELVVDCTHPTDECVTAAPISDGVNGPYSTAFATTSAPAWPSTCVFNPGNDCWFSYRANCTAPHTFSTCTPARTFDTCIEVFDGGCSALTSIGCNDDAGGSCGTGSSVTVNLTAGNTYHIRVGGYNGTTGAVELKAEPGSGAGALTTIAHACGPMTISVTGDPRIGGTMTATIGGHGAGLPFVGFGFLPGSPFCTCT
ncbi:MAG: hypothetical protein KDC98_00640, partial [Planctomycetes bacterium]|nr:hypothetical protein [Planctomycetota bacterium]